uniref:Uncharacterized protein n=1 Tax=Siphoviridae sp. ctKwY15 TaxID=2827843 RepID=A0A8S5SU91_9CAUD|nr:MAG TPA: hypothetical protein [Siphoviridae sp. ctKwY15]
MEIGWILVIIGILLIGFCLTIIIKVLNGKIEGIVMIEEKVGVSVFLLICLFIGYALLHSGIIILKMCIR